MSRTLAILVAAAVTASALALAAQAPQHPDFTGVWTNYADPAAPRGGGPGRGGGPPLPMTEEAQKKVAAYRDSHGALTLRSAVCTHMGCVVGWNDAEGTWDCPCHGSRYTPQGDVISGPAESPLAEAGKKQEAPVKRT